MSISINPKEVTIGYQAAEAISVPVRLYASGDTAGCQWRPTVPPEADTVTVGSNVIVSKPQDQEDGTVLFEVTAPPWAGTHQVTLELSDGADRSASALVKLVGIQ
jgi:hypothetical protein